MSKTNKAVNIQRDFYTMATADGTTAEITMYGEIVETQPVDWWTGEPIEGQYIIQSEFMEDLNTIAGCKDITIRMDSIGGNAGVAILIHNRLRELAANGASLTCIVDGVAMSGGSLIMCACDNVRVNPSSLIMIHKCWCFLRGGYNADDLRSIAESNDAYDKAQASIYTRKTKLSETKILHMMSETTYMTGKEAVDKGFADELLDTAEELDISASADGKSLFVRGRKMHLAPGMTIPDNIPKVKAAEAPAVDDNNTNAIEGGNIMAQTIDELRAEYPELTAQMEADIRDSVDKEAVNAAVMAERNRIKEIDEMAALFSDSLVHDAKYGDDPCSAKDMTYRAAQEAAKTGQKFMAGLKKDAEASGASNVGAAPSGDDGALDDTKLTSEQKMNQARNTVSGLLGKKKEGE